MVESRWLKSLGLVLEEARPFFVGFVIAWWLIDDLSRGDWAGAKMASVVFVLFEWLLTLERRLKIDASACLKRSLRNVQLTRDVLKVQDAGFKALGLDPGLDERPDYEGEPIDG